MCCCQPTSNIQSAYKCDLLNRRILISMDPQKSNCLQATSDSEPLIADSFLLQGLLTDLYLYPTELKLLQKHITRTIPIHLSLTFALVQGEKGHLVALELSDGEETIRLERDFWPRAREWESLLLNHLTRKDFHEFFKPIKKIGRGNFATVYLAQDRRVNRFTAIKAFMKEYAFKGDGKAAIENEVRIMRKLKSSNIATLYGVYQTKNSLYLSMQYVEGMTLESFLRKYKETTTDQRRRIMRGLLSGLKELAQLRIVHRDIKPENLLLSQNCENVKIVDFGLATHIDDPSYIFVRCGTPGYVAPEILKIRDVEQARLGVESDVFSLGAIYYQMIYGQPLFQGKDQTEVLAQNRQCKIKVGRKEGVAFDELELLCRMLQSDPKTRITAQDALKSKFLYEKKEIFRRALQPIMTQSEYSWVIEDS